jgi:hypothetical protein
MMPQSGTIPELYSRALVPWLFVAHPRSHSASAAEISTAFPPVSLPEKFFTFFSVCA